MIAMGNQPFLFVENKGFIKLLAELKPRYGILRTKYFNETIVL